MRKKTILSYFLLSIITAMAFLSALNIDAVLIKNLFDFYRSKIVVGEKLTNESLEILKKCGNEFFCEVQNIRTKTLTDFEINVNILQQKNSPVTAINQLLNLRNSEQIARNKTGVCLDMSIYACGLAKALNITCYLAITDGILNQYTGQKLRHAFVILTDGENYYPIMEDFGDMLYIQKI